MIENEYLIKSYRKGKEIVHSYEIMPCDEVKNAWKTQKISGENFEKFKRVVRETQKVVDEIGSISGSHKDRMEKNKDIGRLETKLIITKTIRKQND